MRVIVIGSGVAGLTAAWLCARRHEVTVLEAEREVGGHTRTVPVATARGSVLGVDTGFIVYNEPTYPLFSRLLSELGVATQPSDMSWSLSCRRCGLEYAGSAAGALAQPRRVADPAHWRMLADIARFNRLGRRLVGDPRIERLTVRELLDRLDIGHGAAQHYVLPMVAAIWSSGTADSGAMPAATMLRFFDNHGLLGLRTHHPWRTVTGGAAAYLAPLTAPYRERVRTGFRVAALHRDRRGVRALDAHGHSVAGDVAIVATHADQALGLLADPDGDERELLGAWRYASSRAVLHTDQRALPRARRARASWNYALEDCRAPTARATLTYDLTRMQRLEGPERYLVTLNPDPRPAPAHRVDETTFAHPVMSAAAVATQPRLDALDGRRRTYFAGAYQRHGFHEDAVAAAVGVAARLGIRWPR